MAEGIRAPNLPLGTDLSEFVGIETVGSQKSLRRFTRASVTGAMDAVIGSFQAGGGVIFTTKAQANANLNYDAMKMAWVVLDPAPANNGVYQKSGAPGAGAWTKLAELPYSFYRAVNEGAGTVNAIKATNGYPMANKDALIVLNITDTNTASPVTLALNDGAPLTIKTASGNDVSVGGLAVGMLIAGYIDDVEGEFRLISDQASAAIQSAAEAAQAAAEAARDVATGAMSVFQATVFATKAVAQAYTPSVAPDYIRLEGNLSVGVGGALYKKAASEPSHEGKLFITLSDGVTVVWYEIAESVLNPFQFSAIVVGDTAAHVQSMFTAAVAIGASVHFPALYRCDSVITVSNPGGSVKITNSGPGCGLNFSQGSGQLLIIGALDQIDDISTDLAKGDRVLQWSSDQGLAARDIVVIYNPTDYSWGSRRDYYRDGAMFRIHSMDGNAAHIYGQTVDSYTAADFDVYKMSPVTVDIDGLTVIGSESSSVAPLTIRYGADCTIRRVSGHGGVYCLIEMDRCFNSDVDASPVINNSPVVDDEYGIIITNCHHTNIRGSASYATRHAVALGGRTGDGCVPNRFTTISGMTLFNQSINAASADAHGNCDFTKYVNCTLLSGASVGGRNVSLVDCEVFEWPADDSGYCYWVSECVGGIYKFQNVTFRSNGKGETYAYLYLEADGAGNGTNRPTETAMRDDLHVIIDGLTIVSPFAGSLAKAVQVVGNNANKKINVSVVGAGILWDAPQGVAFVYVNEDVLTSVPSDFVIVDKVQGPSGVAILLLNSTGASIPTRQMPQIVSTASLSCTSGAASAVSSPLTYRFPYSKIPQAMGVSHRATDGAAKVAWGGKAVHSAIYSITEAAATLVVEPLSGENFSSTESIAVAATVGIAEV